MNKNPFFNIAVENASRLLGRKGRIIPLLAKLGAKLQHVKWSEAQSNGVKEKFFTMGRLLKAYASGQYREIPWKTLLLITAAVIYFVNPIDLVPDLIPVLGLTDDFGILLSVYSAISTEIDKFILWERSQVVSDQ